MITREKCSIRKANRAYIYIASRLSKPSVVYQMVHNTTNRIKKEKFKSKFGHVKRNYLEKKLKKFIRDNVDETLINILSPEDFSIIFVDEIKKLNESDALTLQIEKFLQILITNTIKNSVRIKKIQNNKYKNKMIDERESQRIQDYSKEKDILFDNSTYGIADVGLKLGKTELSVLSNIKIGDEFELHLCKYNQKWRKFCTKLCKIL